MTSRTGPPPKGPPACRAILMFTRLTDTLDNIFGSAIPFAEVMIRCGPPPSLSSAWFTVSALYTDKLSTSRLGSGGGEKPSTVTASRMTK